MANLKQILQSNNTNIANAINEQNKNIKNYIDNKDAVLQNDIDAINNEQTGILAQAKQDADKKDENVKNSLIGTTKDNKDSDTIYGVKKYVEERITEEKEQYFKGETVAENFKTQLLSVREITADSDVTSGLPTLNIKAPSLTITAGAGDNYPGTGVDIQAQNISIQSASEEKPQVVSIKNLTDPTNDYDAAHKKYIDKQINTLKTVLIGNTNNTSEDNTIYGVKKYVEEQVAKIPDDVITEDKLAEKGYLVTIPDEYVTETEFESEFKSELNKYISSNGNIEINKDWNSIENKPNYINNLATEANEQTVLITNQNFSSYDIAKQSDLQDYIKKVNGLEKDDDENWTIGNNAVYINPTHEIKLSTQTGGISIDSANILSLSGAGGINIKNSDTSIQLEYDSISLTSPLGISLSSSSEISLSSSSDISLNSQADTSIIAETIALEVKDQINLNDKIYITNNNIQLGGDWSNNSISIVGLVTFEKPPSTDAGSSFNLYSPNGKTWMVSITNDGKLTAKEIETKSN